MLRSEGFAEVEYIEFDEGTIPAVVAAGRADLSMETAPAVLPALDARLPVTVLGGVHAGCYELIGNERVTTIRDLKGKRVAIAEIGAGDHVYIASMLSYIGIDPRKDIDWIVAHSIPMAMQNFLDGRADAFIAFPPQPQELRAKGIGHVIVNTVQDRPWSQYFCCVLIARRDFVTKYPVATKRALRAIYKAADLCASSPEAAAKYLTRKNLAENYSLALDVMKTLPFRRWREADPEDTLRFHALRLYEVGMIKTSPNKLIEQGTNWRFLRELKKELKA
jgi:NitT/TauT family transport system substrate-binding protein